MERDDKWFDRRSLALWFIFLICPDTSKEFQDKFTWHDVNYLKHILSRNDTCSSNSIATMLPWNRIVKDNERKQPDRPPFTMDVYMKTFKKHTKKTLLRLWMTLCKMERRIWSTKWLKFKYFISVNILLNTVPRDLKRHNDKLFTVLSY